MVLCDRLVQGRQHGTHLQIVVLCVQVGTKKGLRGTTSKTVALWQQDGQLQNGKWSYFEKSGAMVADRAVPASDGESYVIGKDGYLANRKDAGYNIHDIVKLGDGQEYLLNAKR